MLTNEQITEQWDARCDKLSGWDYGGTEVMLEAPFEEAARAIEAAACAERDQRIAEIERQLEEARKDAERYRWIVAVCETDGFGYWLPEVCLKEGSLPPSKEESDAAIDAAMKGIPCQN